MSTDETRRELRERLLQWLRQDLPQDRADRLFYHLGDLHDAFANAMRLIEELPDREQPGGGLRRSLAALAGELIDHIPAHLQEVAPDLEAWRDQIYADAEQRGEL